METHHAAKLLKDHLIKFPVQEFVFAQDHALPLLIIKNLQKGTLKLKSVPLAAINFLAGEGIVQEPVKLNCKK